MIFAQSVFSVHRILEDMQEFKICYQKKVFKWTTYRKANCSTFCEASFNYKYPYFIFKTTQNLKNVPHKTDNPIYIDLPTRPFSPLLEYFRNLIISSQKMIQKSNSNWFDQIFSKRCSKCQSEFNKINFEHSYWSETIGFEKRYKTKRS